MNCDRIARWYRWFEYAGFGRALERRREAFLNDVADARRVLALGDGRRQLRALVQALLAAAPRRRGSITLTRARGCWNWHGHGRATERVTYVQADDADHAAARGREYDLIVTHFFLDCFEEADPGICWPGASIGRPRPAGALGDFGVSQARMAGAITLSLLPRRHPGL